jgi:Ca2+:H+ antiporter
VKASITGSIIGNVLLVLGAAFLFGGLKNGTQTFDARASGVNASIMTLAIMAMMIPAIFALGAPEHRPTNDGIVRLSDGTAIVLIILYAFYLLGTIFLSGNKKFAVGTIEEGTAEGNAAPLSGDAGDVVAEGSNGVTSLPKALGILLVSTVAIVFMSEILVGALEPTAEQWGLSELFVGVILVPVVGNIAEHLVAVQVALKNHMELSIGIAVGSAVQIALFVAPVLILVSQFVGPEPMTLVFNQFELVALVAAILITVVISIDGESNWLEGVQLIALYVIIAIAFFFVP